MLREGKYHLKRPICTGLTGSLEVESLIESAAREAIVEDAELEPFRPDIVEKLVQALETDAAWVELYGVTGELVPAKVKMGDGKLGLGQRQVMEVGLIIRTTMQSSLLTVLADLEPETIARVLW